MTSKRIAASLAAIITVSASFGHYPVCTQKADVKTPSVRAFADSVLPRLQNNSNTLFESVCYNKEENTLLRDGINVPGDKVSGLRVIDGELRITASETVRSGETAPDEYLSLDEAAELIGLETHETAAGICVSEPFRSGTLIVKSEDLSDTKGGSEVGGCWNDLHVLQYPTAADAYTAYQAFQMDDSIIFAEPNRTYHIEEAEVKESSGYEFPGDNWGWEAVGAGDFLMQYEESAASAPDVVVAVIDTGIYPDHNWFQGRIAEGGAGFINENDGTYVDGHGHGTHCSGVICGMTPDNVKILPIKALSDSGYGDTLGIYCAMIYAGEQNADVVSMSFGGTGSSPMFEEAIRFLNEKEIVCVAAAGNEVMDAKYFSPANIPDVITVSSLSNVFDSMYIDYGYKDTRTADEKANAKYWLSPFSNFGEGIDFAAPGDFIDSAYINSPDSIAGMSGTSMACPHVAACVADVLTVRNDYTADEVYNCLKSNAYDLGDLGFDSKYGWGMINIADPDLSISALPQPESSVKPGNYQDVFTVTLSTPEPDAEIRYTTDGTYPDIDTGTLYQGEEILIDNTTDLYAVTVKDGKRSARAHWRYQFKVNEPVISPKPGNFDEPVTIELSAPHADCMYYTLDGSDPDPETSEKYTGPITITESTILKVIVVIGRYVSEPFGYYYTINGQTSDQIFESENGVLTHYYGFEEELDLNDYFEPGKITMIGNEVFKENESLKKIILPDSVTSVGAFAFYYCTKLSSVTAHGLEYVGERSFESCKELVKFDAPNLKSIGPSAFFEAIRRTLDSGTKLFAEDNQICEIGNGAFISSGLSEAVFPNLEKLGSTVFLYNHWLTKVVLPESITVLPSYVLSGCELLNYLDAPGVTVLEDGALYSYEGDEVKLLEYCTVDYSRLTSIGTESLPIMNETADSVSFDSLTSISMHAFVEFNAKTIRLPALKTIPEGVFDAAYYTSYVYLDSVERIAAGALSPKYYRTPITYIFGDTVLSGQKNPLVSNYDYSIIAAPADSPMIRYAQAAHCQYIVTPDILIPENFCSRIQNETVSLNDCIPLAVNSRLVFTVEETEYDPAYTVPEQPLYTNDNGRVCLNTTVPGKVTVRADLVDDADTVLKSETLEMTIRTSDSGDILTKPDLYLAMWDKGIIRETVVLTDDGEEIQYYGSYVFWFRPEEDGTYYFVPESLFVTVSVFNEQNEQIGFTPEWMSHYDDQVQPVVLKAGETYRVLLETEDYSDLTEMKRSAVNISLQQPTISLGDLDMNGKFVYWRDELPEDGPEIIMCDETGSQIYQKDVDYKSIFWKPGDYGYTGEDCLLEVYGIGAFRGKKVRKVEFYDHEYTVGETVQMSEMQVGKYHFYHVKNDHNDDSPVLFSASYSDSYLHDFTHGKAFHSAIINKTGIQLLTEDLYHLVHYGGLAAYQDLYKPFLEYLTPWEEAEDYCMVIGFGGYEDDPPAPAGSFILSSKHVNSSYSIGMCDFDYESDLTYTGKKNKIWNAVRKTDGTVLEEGKDYEIYIDNDCIPGDANIIIRGIGDYFGTMIEHAAIFEPTLHTGFAALKPVNVDEPFKLSQYSSCYELNTDSGYQCRLRKTNSPDPDSSYIYSIYKYDYVYRDWKKFHAGNGIEQDSLLDLDPGSYRIYIAQYDQEMEFVLETEEQTLTGISNAEVHSKTLTYTGEKLTPEITLNYEGRQLTEGEDYVLLLPDKPILEPGIYSLIAAGMGSFGGECSICVVVKNSEDTADQEVKIGSNAMEISETGQTAFASWIPDQEHYGISLHELNLLTLTIYDPETNMEVTALDGSGYLYDFFDVTPGKEYVLYTSWVEPHRTAPICFTLLSDYIDLTACTVDMEKYLIFTGQGQMPEFTVRNGETVLQKDTDFSIYYNGGNCEPGHAMVSLIGTGNCIGELICHYFLCPDTDEAAFDADEEITKLRTSRTTEKSVLNPGDIQRFEYAASRDGVYHFNRPDPENDGVCVFAFGPDMKLLPFNTTQVSLKRGEKLRFLAVTEHIDEYVKPGVSYSLTVYMLKDGYELQNGDSVYLIKNNAAYLEQYNGDNIGIQLPETVYDPELDEEIPVKGYTDDLVAALSTSAIFYCEPDSEAWQMLQEAGVCFAAPDPQTGIKGDLTGDGIVNGNDWLTLMRWLNECPGMLMSESAFAVSDMNEDGCLDLLDANAIMAIVNSGQE